jgi:hypothetical protein
LDFGSATYPGIHKPLLLPWLSLAFKLPSGIPDTLCQVKPVYLKASYCRLPLSMGLLEPPVCGVGNDHL